MFDRRRRDREATWKKRRMFLEMLEPRQLLSASPNVDPRPFPFTLSGSYTGKNPGTYISLPSKQQVPYLDSFSGSLTGAGVVEYTDNVSGSGRISLDDSPGD